jgi:hypothetical protein
MPRVDWNMVTSGQCDQTAFCVSKCPACLSRTKESHIIVISFKGW